MSTTPPTSDSFTDSDRAELDALASRLDRLAQQQIGRESTELPAGVAYAVERRAVFARRGRIMMTAISIAACLAIVVVAVIRAGQHRSGGAAVIVDRSPMQDAAVPNTIGAITAENRANVGGDIRLPGALPATTSAGILPPPTPRVSDSWRAETLRKVVDDCP
jgi:hypothetical protein